MKNNLKLNRIVTYALLSLIGWGILLRLYQFGRIPAGLNRDEAALGYNAFSIANYGVDEWNRKWPLIFESFGDDKLPGYIYVLAPLIKLAGVHDWAIRLPSLLAGMVLIYLTYLIVKFVTQNQTAALLGAAVTAINPWAIFYSRTAYEAHLALMFMAAALYQLTKPTTKKNIIFLTLSYLAAVLTYNSPLILMPLLVIYTLSLPNKSLKEKGWSLLPLIITALMMLILLKPLISQKQNITIFSDPTIKSQINTNYSLASSQWERFFKTKYMTWAAISVNNIYESVGPRFLLTKGGNHPWHSVPGRGHVLGAAYALFLAAVILILFKKVSYWRYGLSWLLLTLGALLPAVVTVDAPHATRSLLFLWGIGVVGAMAAPKLKNWVLIFVLMLLLESLSYAQLYYRRFPNLGIKPYPTGFEQAAKSLAQVNEEVAITNQAGISSDILSDQVYIWLVLYDQMPPPVFQQSQVTAGRDAAGLIRINQFGKYKVYNEPAAVPAGAIRLEKQADNTYIRR